MISALIFFLFVQVSLLIPGYALIKRTGIFKENPGLELCISYMSSIAFFGLLACLYYIFDLPKLFIFFCNWLVILASLLWIIKNQAYVSLYKLRYPIIILLAVSFISVIFITLPIRNSRNIIPDPEPMQGRNYNTLNVKILNLSDTSANDNYIPYRQAQFIVNRSDPAKDSFINEWGVHFFQRTPLMGLVTADYFLIINNKLPVNYSWSNDTMNPNSTYIKFQILAQILNYLFIIPAFFLLKKIFNVKVAAISLLFISINQYFLYNSFFTWPKSFVAFFILLSWILILENKYKYVVVSAIASGLAYLTHDLAIIYICTSIVVLLYQRNIKKMFIFIGVTVCFVLPWIITSAIIYKRQSSFIYFPFSTHGIPQAGKGEIIIKEFFHTPLSQLISIKIENILYLLSPYQMFTSEGGRSILKRMWGLSLFSIAGSTGIGLIIPIILGLFNKIKSKVILLIYAFLPILLSVIITGWPKGLGSLHFAEASVVILIGLGIGFLVLIKNKFWLYLCFIINLIQYVCFALYCYNFSQSAWLNNPVDIIKVTIMLLFIVAVSLLIYIVAKNKSRSMNVIGLSQ